MLIIYLKLPDKEKALLAENMRVKIKEKAMQ